jgi:hypothetical protein
VAHRRDAHASAVERELAVCEGNKIVGRLAGDREDDAAGMRPFDGDERLPARRIDELDVVGDDVAFEALAHGGDTSRRHVEPHLVSQDVHPHVRHDLTLLRQQRCIGSLARLQAGDVVRQHALEEADSICSGKAQQAAEAGIEQPAAPAHGGPLVRDRRETSGQCLPGEGREHRTAGLFHGFQLCAHGRTRNNSVSNRITRLRKGEAER